MDGPSADPGSSRRISGIERHPGLLSFGYFSLEKQRKVTRPRAETRIKHNCRDSGIILMTGFDRLSRNSFFVPLKSEACQSRKIHQTAQILPVSW